MMEGKVKVDCGPEIRRRTNNVTQYFLKLNVLIVFEFLEIVYVTVDLENELKYG